jgi:hypothetical protein
MYGTAIVPTDDTIVSPTSEPTESLHHSSNQGLLSDQTLDQHSTSSTLGSNHSISTISHLGGGSTASSTITTVSTIAATVTTATNRHSILSSPREIGSEDGTAIVRYEQGEAMARAIGAYRYMECSARTKEGVNEVFEVAARAALCSRIQRLRRHCVLL